MMISFSNRLRTRFGSEPPKVHGNQNQEKIIKIRHWGLKSDCFSSILPEEVLSTNIDPNDFPELTITTKNGTTKQIQLNEDFDEKKYDELLKATGRQIIEIG
jgi:hypothetical protein